MPSRFSALCGMIDFKRPDDTIQKTLLDPQSALSKLDPIWAHVRREAEEIVRREPGLSTFIYSVVLHHDRLENSIVHRVAEQLDHPELSGDLIRKADQSARRDEPDLGNAFRADMIAESRRQHIRGTGACQNTRPT